MLGTVVAASEENQPVISETENSEREEELLFCDGANDEKPRRKKMRMSDPPPRVTRSQLQENKAEDDADVSMTNIGPRWCRLDLATLPKYQLKQTLVFLLQNTTSETKETEMMFVDGTDDEGKGSFLLPLTSDWNSFLLAHTNL